MDKLNVDMTAKCEMMQVQITNAQDIKRVKERQRGQLDVRLNEIKMQRETMAQKAKVMTIKKMAYEK